MDADQIVLLVLDGCNIAVQAIGGTLARVLEVQEAVA
jgi:hypothetical protein